MKLKIDLSAAALFLATAPPFSGLFSGRVNAALMVVAFLLLMIDRKDRMNLRFVVWAASFAGWCLLSALWASDRSTILSTTLSFVQTVMLWYVVEDGCVGKPENLMFALKCMLFGAILHIIKTFSTSSISALISAGRLSGVGNGTSVRFMLLAVLLYMNRKEFKYRAVPIIGIVLLVLFSFMQGSRKGIIILALGLLLTFFSEAREKNNILQYVRVLISIAAVIAILYIVCMKTSLYNTIGIRIENTITFLTTQEAVDGSTSQRNDLIGEAWRVWLQHPLLGVGQNNFKFVNSVSGGMYAHNNYLELLANLGIIGFLIYYSYIIRWTVKSAVLYVKNRDHRYIQPIAVFLMTLITSYMMVSYSSEAIYVYMGYAAAYYNAIAKQPKIMSGSAKKTMSASCIAYPNGSA